MKFPALATLFLAVSIAFAQPHHWTPAEANQWYSREPWLVGANFVPSSAENQMEMWQEATFDHFNIDRELGLAESLGMNTMRVFLHDLLWERDSSGFEKRINTYLRLADKHHIKTIFVLFDSVWDPFPETGPQQAPRTGIHNSRWMQSPGDAVLMDRKQYDRVLAYVHDLIFDYRADKRILAWDVWNEPENPNSGSYGKNEPANKEALAADLLQQVFQFARAATPSQPLTSGLWHGDWSDPAKLTAIEKVQLDNSDIITFHSYEPPEAFEKRIESLQQYHRPILCTEYMARPAGSTFQGILPIAKKHNVAAINWGLVAGRTQTWYPWDSWQKPYPAGEPKVWFHDIFRANGEPYSQEEVAFIRSITGQKKGKAARK